MRITSYICLMALVFGTQCSTSPGVSLLADLSDEPDLEQRVPDAVIEVGVLPDLPAESDVLDVWIFELPPADAGGLCAPDEGCFLSPCQENADCQSGWCVEHMGESVCSQTCHEECIEGWSCKQVAGTDPDVVFICVSDFANLCKPCASVTNCTGPGGVDDACVDYGEEGSFCGGGCTADEVCPWGFSCEQAVTVDGVELAQCVADAGVCPCTAKSVSLGLWTPCQVTGEWGTCEGKRVCTEDGLSPCDAPTPSPELCNGIDDDCDGEVDEDSSTPSGQACDDGNQCTEDVCSGAEGCEFVALDGGECLDGNPCTVADHCVAGVCAGDPVVCEDENECTDNVCMENGGCDYPPNTGGCDDGNPCTVGDQCGDGKCEGILIPCDCQSDADCADFEDGDVCNGTLICDKGSLPYQCAVEPGTEVVCPDPEGPNAPCLVAECDPLTGDCHEAATPDGIMCEDGDKCTLSDFCQEGLCTAGVEVNCNDGNPCTDDGCDPASGCFHTHNSGPCDDGDVCTKDDFCDSGDCLSGQPLQCDDDNLCTADTCDPALGCDTEPLTGPECDDGNACTTGDHCEAGWCTFAGSEICQDNNVCTTDSCDPAVGCVYALNDDWCDDGDLCTHGDHCHLGACIAAGNLDCDDGNLCTIDGCAPGGGCTHAPNSDPCDDGNSCTVGDQCADKACVPGDALTCNDGSPCTLDVCLWDQGCEFLLLPDGGLCQGPDICLGLCSEGVCEETAVEVCDGVDNTCEGDIDEGFVDTNDDGEKDCVDSDDDGDGVLDDVDCEPLDPGIHAGALDICGNGVDEDCDGFDEADTDGDGVCDDDDVCPDGDDTKDADDDGTPDDCDACDGGDDSLDGDDDGVPDDCDICLAGNDNEDSDDDTVPDACDICPGGDDLIDLNDDGIPDACESDCLGIDSNGDGIADNCPLSVLIADGYGADDLSNHLVSWGFTTNIVSGNVLDGSYNYDPYDVVAFMYSSPCDSPSHLMAENIAGNVGIVFHRGDDLVDNFDMGSAGFYQSGTFAISDDGHFISEVFPVGPLPLDYTYKSRLKNPTGSVRVLGNVEEASLAVHKTYRRVVTPYYGHTSGMPWNADAAELTWRSYVWAAGIGPQ